MSTSQKTATIYGSPADGLVMSNDGTYSTCRNGPGYNTVAGNTDIWVGQDTGYFIFEGFLFFDTGGIPPDATIDSVTLHLAMDPANFDTAATLQVREHPWMPPLGNTHYVDADDLSAKTLLASIASASMTGLGAYDSLTIESPEMEAAIVPGGLTTFIMTTNRVVAANTPTDDEWAKVASGESSMRPKLTVTYTSEDTIYALGGYRPLVVRPFSDRASGAEQIARSHDSSIVDWWVDDEVAHGETRPTENADIPRSHWYVVDEGTPGVSLRLETKSEKTPEVIFVLYSSYGDPGIRDGTLRKVYYPAAPSTAIVRTQMENLPSQYMDYNQAFSYAANLYNRAASESIKATITVVGGLYTVDHLWTPAPLIMSGHWIDIVSENGHKPVYITARSYDPQSHTVTITTGGQEHRELIVPGFSSLPTSPTVYSGGASGDSGGGDGEKKGTYDPGPTDTMITKTGTGAIVLPPGSSVPIRRL